MLNEKTCLILGAGASRPYGLPTSGELRHLLLGGSASGEGFAGLGWQIGRQGTELLDRALKENFSQTEIAAFRTEFFDSQRLSIDLFLAYRKDDFEVIGKFAIATAILMCEQARRLDGDWYQWLFERLVRNGPDIDANKLSIITFNYDRSLEFFLRRAFKAAFKLRSAAVDELMGRIEFLHVYGDVGPLMGFEGERVGFGEAARAGIAATSINVVAPRTEPPTAKRIGEIVGECERICFLGFGFWKENLDLLQLKVPTRKKVFASCFQLPRSTKNDVLHRFTDIHDQTFINFGTEDQDVMRFLTHWNVM
jgi:hypothetical protein